MPVVHSISRSISLAGSLYYPNSVEAAEQHGRQGIMHEADDGGVRQTITGTKRRYRYVWDKPNPTVYAALVALGASAVTIIDHNGATWSALIPIGSPSHSITHGDVASTVATEYAFSCEFWET